MPNPIVQKYSVFLAKAEAVENITNHGMDLPDNNNEEEKDEMKNGINKDENGAFLEVVTKKLHHLGNIVAQMPTEKPDTHYNMNHKSRGLALIFNHEVFEIPGKDVKPRTGTARDRKDLEEVLRGLGFEVLPFQDLKYNDIEYQIKQVAKSNHTDHDCLCITVLTHGDPGILYARDTTYKPDILWNHFTEDRCPTLAGKPKIFFMQACQGKKLDKGIMVQRTETDGHALSALTSYRIPIQPDFLIVCSTVKDYFSWRNTANGSWFVQSLCEELRARGFEIDLLTLLTFVSRRVALDFESNVPDSPIMHQQKEIPCVLSMLRRLIQFTRGKEGWD